MWTVPFKEYMQFEGVKDNIRHVKQRKKATVDGRASMQLGLIMEDYVVEALHMNEGMAVAETSPQMDMGFGADLKLSYVDGDKHDSFFVDVTMADKQSVEYINREGETTPDIEEAYVLDMKDFEIRFGLKRRHSAFFFYHKPVITLSIRIKDTLGSNTFRALDKMDALNLGHMMRTVNEILMEEGHGARASQKVRPNPKIYAMEYRRYINSLNK